MLNTNLKTTENKKVEVFVHFSTIVKLDSNAGSVTAAVPCSWWELCEARLLQPSLREEKLDLLITTNNMFAIFSFFFLFFSFKINFELYFYLCQLNPSPSPLGLCMARMGSAIPLPSGPRPVPGVQPIL